jgi:hypothetical protein
MLLAFASAVFLGSESLDSRPYFTVSDLRLPFSSPPTTRRVTVDVFDPASTRVSLTHVKSKSKSFHELSVIVGFSLCSLGVCPHRKHAHCLAMDVLCCCIFVGTCLPSNGLFTGNLSLREGVYRAVA